MSAGSAGHHQGAGTAAGPMPTPVLNIRRLGARGDGVSDDTSAFQQAAAAIAAAGGGTLLIPPGVYRVGRQTLSGAIGQGGSWKPEPIFRLQDCVGPVRIIGLGPATNRPTLRAADGLRFGSFDPITGQPAVNGLPFTNYDFRADAYTGMFELWRNADVRIENLVLDGNMNGLALGGPWGDVGYQCGATGVTCVSNERVSLQDLDIRDHGLDGIMIANWGGDDVLRPHDLERVSCTGNGRQGLSWVGCSGLSARHCRFLDTGRGRITSAPAAALDIEPEDTQMHTASFEHCEFGNSVGVSVISDNPAAGSSVSGVRFTHCTINGGDQYAILVRNEEFEFDQCRINGCLAFNPGRQLAAESIRIRNSLIHDRDPAAHRYGVLIDCSFGEPNLFEACTIVTYAQRLGHMSNARLRRCVFVAALVQEYAGGTDWILIVYRALVDHCEFRDELPLESGPILTINYSNETELIAPAVIPPDGRLRLFNAS
ncbi:MAG: glycosyl hydrolase family 28-related protein [Burkholderiaceae bacterium]